MKLCMNCGELLCDVQECQYCHSTNIKDLAELNINGITMGDYLDIRKVTHNADKIIELLELKSSDPAEYQRRMSQMQPLPKVPYSSKPTVKCPYCGGYNCQKISGMSKAVSIGLWGLFSGKIGKQWHCNGCGSDF